MIWTLRSEEISTLINDGPSISARGDEGQALIGGEAGAETPSKGLLGTSGPFAFLQVTPRTCPPRPSLTPWYTGDTGGRCRTFSTASQISVTCAQGKSAALWHQVPTPLDV